MTESNELAIVPLDQGGLVMASHFAQYEGEGKQDIAGIGVKNPRLHIVQAASPERKSKKAQDGQLAIRNVPGVDGSLIYDKLTFCIAQFKQCWVKWKRTPDGKRDPNAKFPEWSFEEGHVPAEHLHLCEWKDDPKNPGKRVPPDATLTFSFLAVTLGTDPLAVVMGFDGPAIGAAREFLAKLNNAKMMDANKKPFDPPLWAWAIELSTVENSNEKGQWYDPCFKIVGAIPQAAVEFVRKGSLETPRDAW